ncbi:KRFJ protein, partial [Ploceus nigricollis]|nr:KRFJ protein [Ploceus nigricollis]
VCAEPCPDPRAAACNEPCVVACPDSRVIIFPPPVVVTFPGPILTTSCPQESIVGSAFPEGMGNSFGFGAVQSSYEPGASPGGWNFS